MSVIVRILTFLNSCEYHIDIYLVSVVSSFIKSNTVHAATYLATTSTLANFSQNTKQVMTNVVLAELSLVANFSKNIFFQHMLDSRSRINVVSVPLNYQLDRIVRSTVKFCVRGSPCAVYTHFFSKFKISEI